MNKKFTPGPWQANGNGVYAAGGTIGILKSYQGSYGHLTEVEKGLNLQLAAAAPDLLAACEAILLRLDVEAKEQGEDAVFLGNALRSQLRAAIEKAINE